MSHSILDALFYIGIFVLTFLSGLPLARLIPKEILKHRLLLSSIFGYGAITFVANAAYPLGVTHSTVLIFFCLWALIVLSTVIVKNRRHIATRTPLHGEVGFRWIFLISALLLALPHWTGGPKFSIVQGSVQDHFSYLSAALTFSNETFTDVQTPTAEFFLKAPVAIYGTTELFRRPGVMHLYGVLSQFWPADTYRLAYLFLAFLCLNGVLAGTFLLTNIFNFSLVRVGIISAALFWGFWGQMFFDWNAWSMTASIPVLIATLTYLIVSVDLVWQGESVRLSKLLPLSLLIGFGFFLYPENVVFHMPAFLFLVLLTLRGRLRPLVLHKLRPSLTVLGAVTLGTALTIFYFRGTFKHVFWAVDIASGNFMIPIVWENYMRPIFGQAQWLSPLVQDASDYSLKALGTLDKDAVFQYILRRIFLEGDIHLAYYAVVDGLAGILGVYFLTPLAAWESWVQELVRFVIAMAGIYFCWITWRAIQSFKSPRFTLLLIFTGLLVSQLIVLVITGRLYGAARGLPYAMPYVFFCLVAPAVCASAFRSSRYITIPASFLILAHLGFGISRPILAHFQTPHVPLVYSFAEPPIDNFSVKTQLDWDFKRFDSTLKNCQRVFLDIPLYTHEWMATLYLYSHGKPYTKATPVRTSYIWNLMGPQPTDGGVVGFQRLMGNENCKLTVVERPLPDGKPFYELVLLKASGQNTFIR